MIQCWINFGKFSGLHPAWTLAVEAVSERDARAWVKAAYGGGKLLQRVPPDGRKITAACGAMTDAAQAELSEKRRQREGER